MVNELSAAARLVLHKRQFDHITADIRDRLHWLPLQQRVKYKVSLWIHKCLHQAAPSYLAEICIPVSATDNRCHLRSATRGDLAVPRIRLARYGRRSLSVSGLLLWNSLPLTVCDVSLTLTQFSAWLQTFLFSRAELMGHRHSTSVTVSAVKFVCVNTNLLTYLLNAGVVCDLPLTASSRVDNWAWSIVSQHICVRKESDV